ncbi:TPA: hypothetical protein EYQ19_02150, partial [Candidatus Pacearchaeota archaeon]|nr:hypothetical protein [Candidatus Pacearchaeota archaeon]
MPITTDAVAISKKAVNEFIESDDYRRCKNADLIFAEFLSDDGGKLFLFEPNRIIQVKGIDEEEFIWVSIDDEDNLGVMGQWQESPFNFDISTQMSIIVDDKSEVENLIQSFDYSILEDKAFSKICKDFIDSSLEFDDWYDETSFKKTEIILEKYNLDGGDFEDLAKSSHEKNFLKDTGFDSSNSTNSTFIGVFEPDLKALMKYKSIIEDITGDLKEFGDEVFACSTFDTYNYELIETLAEKESKITGSGFDGYEVYFMGFIETIVSEKVEEIKKEIPGIKSKKAKSRLISMIASEIENITGKNHDDARDYVLYIQQNHTRDYYSPVPLITVTSNQESTEIKSRLESLGVKIEVAGVDNFLEIQKDIDKSDATDFKTKLEEIGVQVKIVASTKSTEPYINVGVDELISYPSIHAYGFSGSGANGWNG